MSPPLLSPRSLCAVALLLAPACRSLPECEALCAREASCAEAEIERYQSNWEDFTGFSSRDAYEDACMAVFEESFETGSGRTELQQTCHEELAVESCPEP